MPSTQPPLGHPDRRSVPRYLLSLPVSARAAQDAEPFAGMSRDISVRGIYFFIDQLLATGSVLDLSFTMPADITEGMEVFVVVQGRILRVEGESDAERIGVAVVIDKHEIVRAKPSQP